MQVEVLQGAKMANEVSQNPASQAGEQPPRKQMTMAVAFSCFGWAFDLYDLFILLYVAPVLARVFFPSTHPMLSLAGVYAAFTATLFMRPLGGVLFGPYADRYGRKRAMVVAAVGVGLATGLMGLLPTIEQVGIIATVAFLALRLIQGVFMGGMVAATHTLGTESMSPRWRGLASGIISGGGSGIGKLFASLMFLLASWLFPGPAFDQWGWRFMFLTGLLSSALGLLVFSRLQESPLWQAAQQSKAKRAVEQPKQPLSVLVRDGYLPTLAVGVLLTLAGGGLSYLTSGYLPTFLRLVNHESATTIGSAMSLSAVFVMISSVLAGWLTDLIGRRKGIMLYGVINLIALPVLYLALARETDVFWICLFAAMLSGIGTFCYAPLLIILNERFPTQIRSSGTAISWNIGFSLGGSLPTLVSLMSGKPSDLPVVLAVTCGVVSLLYLVVTRYTPETRGQMK